jgi:glycosyltransferase involved in cell wall biosynthesis
VPPAADVVIGYYGAIAHWFDARLVADLARLRPEWRLELVGNTFSSDLRPLAGLPNVRLLGEMQYAELPRRLARWHCCIIPFVRNELTEATNPVKVYEMLAAGMPVVAVDLPELRPIAAAGLIALADDAAGFARKVEALLASQSPAAVAARREFARQNTWHERYRELQAAMAPLECIRHTPCAVVDETSADGTRRVPATADGTRRVPATADGTRRVPDTKAA